MNKRRKEALYDRASRRTTDPGEHAGFIAGYKAAMKDMRKIVRDARRRAMEAGIADAFKRSQVRDFEQRIEIDRFLRPLR